jgi:Hypothetical glycosyl hydrolase family 15
VSHRTRARSPVTRLLVIGVFAVLLALIVTSIALALAIRSSQSPMAAGSDPERSLASAKRKPEPRPAPPLEATGVIRWGDLFRKASGYNRYAYVIVGPADARAAARLVGRSLVYTSGTSIYKSWSAGMTYQEALANQWLLKDSSGTYVMNAQYGAFVGDIGDPSYQKRLIANQLALLRKNGNDGVFLDDVLASPLGLNGSFPAKYPTHEAWESAMVSFTAALGTALRARGYYVLANATAWIPGDTASQTIDRYPHFYEALAPHVNGLVNEYWMQNPSAVSVLRSTGTDWQQNWDAWHSLLTVTQNAGADFFGLTYGTATNIRAMRYGRASFLLDWNGRGGAFIYFTTDHDDPYHPMWVKQIGRPVTPKLERAPGVWQRTFERGIVTLNTTNTSVTLRVNGNQFTIGPTDALFSRAPRN